MTNHQLANDVFSEVLAEKYVQLIEQEGDTDIQMNTAIRMLVRLMIKHKANLQYVYMIMSEYHALMSIEKES